MPENAQMESVAPVNFNNFALKRWLHSIGPVRRCEVLKKLKTDLENLGLSRRKVHRGLMQLATKPRVVLTWQPPNRKSGSQILSENERENMVVDSCKMNATNSQEENEDVRESNKAERIDIEESRRKRKMNDISSIQKPFASHKKCELQNPLAKLHSFDKVLEQFDELTYSKRNVYRKSFSKRTSLTTSSNDEKHVNHIEHKRKRIIRKIPDLVLGKVGTEMNGISNANKKDRIKSNLSSCSSERANSYVNSEIYKNVSTDCVKLHVDKKLHNYRKTTGNKIHSVFAKNSKHSKHENSETVLADTEIKNIKENQHKRKVHDQETSNFMQKGKICARINVRKELNKQRSTNVENKFRTYFGDCKSVSEDEQEREILQKIFKKRRKKDSVDSCDSGVCIAEKNITGADILKDAQETIFVSITNEESNEDIFQRTIANTDTIHNLKEVTNDENTLNQVKDVTNTMGIENELQGDIHVQNVSRKEKEIFQEEIVSISDKNNVEENNNASNDTDILQMLKQSEVSNSVTSMKKDGIALSSDVPEIYNSDHCVVATNEDLSQCEKCNLDAKDLNELLHMSFTDTCEITSNGNVLSIQETAEEVTNKEIDENSNLKKLLTIQTDCNQSVTEMSDCSEKNNNTVSNNIQLAVNKNEINKDSITNNKSNVPSNGNESLIEERELNMSEREDNRSNNIPHGKLRVLSSAELGSRWCPTPINNIISAIPQFSYTNAGTVSEAHLKDTTPVTAVTQTVPITVSLITVPVSTSTVKTTISENMWKSNVDPKFSESVYVTFVKIRNLIQSVRVSSITNLNYDNLLFMEFEKLRKVLNTEDYVDLTEGVIGILNKELLVIPSLSLTELFRYTPIVESFYIRTSNKHKIAVNNINEHQTKVPTIVSSQITSNQNMYCNLQASQNVCVTSVHSRLRHLLSVPTNLNQTSINVTSKQSQQHIQENVISPAQNNFVQNNMSMNSTTVNNHNTQEPNYKMCMYRNPTQQHVSNTYFAKPVTNMCAIEDCPIRYSSFPPTDINQLEGRCIPASNTSFMNQQYIPQSVFVPHANAFYNVNVANNPIQKNINSTHVNLQNVAVPLVTQQYQNTIHRQSLYNMSQGKNQLQTISQHVSSNYNISQPAQMMFPVNTSHSVSMNTQQHKLKHKKIVAHTMPIEVPQKSMPEQVSSQQLQNIYPYKTKQSMLLAKKKRVAETSLESTTKLFDVVKYISHIQKLILLKQLDFYFSCTAWLQQQFTLGQWQKVYSQRSLLLHFQTLLKHLVEKTFNDLLPDKSPVNTFETNILTNIKIDVPKTLQIIVKENEGICCQFEVSRANQEQYKTMSINKNCTTHEGNLNDITTENQCDKEREAINDSQNKELSNLEQSLKIQGMEEIHRNEIVQKAVPLSKENFLVKPNSQIYQTTSININQKDKMREESNSSKGIYTSNIKEHNLNGIGEVTEDVSQILVKNVSILSDTKVSNKDISQQLNSHLVTVEVSSKNDQVIVVNTDVNVKSESMNEECKEYEEYQKQELHITNQSLSLENTSYIITTPSSNSQNNIEHFNNAKLNNSSLEKVTSHIEDVRTISLEAFEKMGETLSNTTEANIEEEEIKVCLFCGKSSTVVCSICLEAKYCSKVCSELHWKDHYKDCVLAERSICN